MRPTLRPKAGLAAVLLLALASTLAGCRPIKSNCNSDADCADGEVCADDGGVFFGGRQCIAEGPAGRSDVDDGPDATGSDTGPRVDVGSDTGIAPDTRPAPDTEDTGSPDTLQPPTDTHSAEDTEPPPDTCNPQPERCDGRDNDCDGKIDEGVIRPCKKTQGVCQGATMACKSGKWPAKCSASQYGKHYERDEITADGRDNDCNGKTDEVFVDVDAGNSYACGVKLDGSLTCWGSPQNAHGQTNPPSGTYSAVSATSGLVCALAADGTIDCWGNQNFGQTKSPPGKFEEVVTAPNRGCARAGGSRGGKFVTWGVTTSPQAKGITDIDCDSRFNCGITSSGTVKCWQGGMESSPLPNFSSAESVAVGVEHGCALDQAGKPHCWGDDAHGQASPPPGVAFDSLSADIDTTCGITLGGQLLCWGRSGSPVITQKPSGTFRDVDVDENSACALRPDNTIVCWGSIPLP